MMKEKSLWALTAVLMVAASCLLIFTDSPSQTDPQKKIIRSQLKQNQTQTFTPLQVSLVPEFGGGIVPLDVPVYGVSMGGMVCQKEIHGFSLAALHAYTQKKSGVSISLFDFCNDSYGLALFAGGGAVHNHGVSIGVWNGAERNDGVQFGIVNQAQKNLLIDPNVQREPEPEDEFGIQTGLINHSEGRGIQFGLWNSNPHSWIPCFPIFNFAL